MALASGQDMVVASWHDIPYDGLEPLRDFLALNGSHPAEDLKVSWSIDMARDQRSITASCAACGRYWVLHLSQAVMRSQGEHIKHTIRVYAQSIATVPCMALTLHVELAEWITDRLTEAGPKGVTYQGLLMEAHERRLCDPRDVDLTLERLGFFIGDKIVLPEGHPNREEW